MKVLSKTFYKLRHFITNDPYWSLQKKWDWKNNVLCVDRIESLWEIPSDIDEISIEIHNKNVAGSYQLQMADYFAGTFEIDKKEEVLDCELTQLVCNQLTKHKKIFVRVLY